MLLAALGGLAKIKRDLPSPSLDGQFFVIILILESAKLTLYLATREAGLNKVALASKLGKQEGEVRRMLDLDHQTKISALEDALLHFGKRIASEVQQAA